MTEARETIVFKVHIPLTCDDMRAIEICAGMIKDGGLVAFPTETVYGLGALAENGMAVRSIFEAKGRPQDNPLIVHVSSFEQAAALASPVPEIFERLARAFWPGPLTLVMASSGRVAPEVTAGLSTVGIRMPDHPVALELIKRAGPIAAPSANLSGRPSPTRAEHVLADLYGRIDAIIDGGPTGVGLESTVLDISSTPPAILRPGGVTFEQLRDVIPDVVSQTPGHQERPRSPGQKYTHYAPRARVVLVRGSEVQAVAWKVIEEVNTLLMQGSKCGILATDENARLYHDLFEKSIENGRVVVLSVGSRRHPESIAAKLFDLLRQFDRANVDTIVAEGVQEMEIGVAIMDRLGRAASKIVLAGGEPVGDKPDVAGSGFGPIFSASTVGASERSVTRSSSPRLLKVLFICTGNTCRSPLAEVVARDIADKAGYGGRVLFMSAGLAAFGGDRASEHARSVAREQGLDLEEHKARMVTEDLVKQADLVVTMTSAHKSEILRQFPWAEPKVHTLGELAGSPEWQVSDPFGKSLDHYRRTAEEIRHFAELLMERLKQMIDTGQFGDRGGKA